MPVIRAIIQDNTFFYAVYETCMKNINKVKHNKCDWSRDTSLYLQSSINVLNACYFTYSQNEQLEQHFRKSFIISYIVNLLQLNFLELLYNFCRLTKVQAQINKCKIFAPYDSTQWSLYYTIYATHNEVSITLSTLHTMKSL